jgi:hypothetical protein
MELDTITWVEWVNQTFKQSLTSKTLNLDSRLQVYGLSTPKAMDNKTWPFDIYIGPSINNEGSENDYTIHSKINDNKICGQEFIVAEFLHVAKTIQQIIIKDLPTSRLKNDQHYYLNML